MCTWIFSVFAKCFSSVNNIQSCQIVFNKNIKYTSVYSDFPCFSFRAVQFSLLLWQYEDHYSENLKIPQITGYFHCIESTFQEIAEEKPRSRDISFCIVLCSQFSLFPHLVHPRDVWSWPRVSLAPMMRGWGRGRGWRGPGLPEDRGLGVELVRSGWQQSITCGGHVSGLRHVYWGQLVTWNTCHKRGVKRWFIGNSYLYWFIDYLSPLNDDCWKRNYIEMTEHFGEIKVTLKTCLPIVLSVLGDLLRDELSGHN